VPFWLRPLRLLLDLLPLVLPSMLSVTTKVWPNWVDATLSTFTMPTFVSFLKLSGLYPALAGKIVSNRPYKTVGELYNIPGLLGAEKDLLKKYESRFTVFPPWVDYVIDNINNGLYR
jgi:hypothetical protein